MKKLISLILFSSFLLLSLVSCDLIQYNNGTLQYNDSAIRYTQGKKLIAEERYEEAYAIFKELGDYKDSAEISRRFFYMPMSLSAQSDSQTALARCTLHANNLPSEVTITYPYGGTDKFSFVFDNNGRLTTLYDIEFEEEADITCYEYDTNGNLIKETTNGIYITEYTYDFSNNLIKQVDISANGSRRITDCIYDTSGNLTRKIHSYSDDNVYTIEYTTNYTYDVSGNLIKEVDTHYNGGESVFEYTYDAAGNLIKEVFGNQIFDYTYDVSGNLIRKVFTYCGTTEYTRTYTCDAAGNVTELVESSYGNVYKMNIQYKLVLLPFDTSEEIAQLLKKALSFE